MPSCGSKTDRLRIETNCTAKATDSARESLMVSRRYGLGGDTTANLALQRATQPQVPVLTTFLQVGYRRVDIAECDGSPGVEFRWTAVRGFSDPTHRIYSQAAPIREAIQDTTIGDTVDFRGKSYRKVEECAILYDAPRVREVTNWQSIHGGVAPTEYEEKEDFELTDHFFFHQNEEQEQLYKRADQLSTAPVLQQRQHIETPVQVRLVTGVAGSGKTSTALGRLNILGSRLKEEDEDQIELSDYRPEDALAVTLTETLVPSLHVLAAKLDLVGMTIVSYERGIRREVLRSVYGNLRRDSSTDQTQAEMEELHWQIVRQYVDRSTSPVRTKLNTYLQLYDERHSNVTRHNAKERKKAEEMEKVGKWYKPKTFPVLPKLRWRASWERIGAAQSLQPGVANPLQRAEETLADLTNLRKRVNEHRKNQARLQTKEHRQSKSSKPIPEEYRMPDLDVVIPLPLKYGLRDSFEQVLGCKIGETRLPAWSLDLLTLYAIRYWDHLKPDMDATEQRRHVLQKLSSRSAGLVDEVQDFSRIQLLAIESLFRDSTGETTPQLYLAGDFLQAIWQQGVADSGAFPFAVVHEVHLCRNERQTLPLRELSAAFRRLLQGDEESGSLGSARPGPPATYWETEEPDALPAGLWNLAHSEGRWAVLCDDRRSARALSRALEDASEDLGVRVTTWKPDEAVSVEGNSYDIHIGPVKAFKGLEANRVIVSGVHKFDLTDRIARDALYVALSRARDELHLVGPPVSGLDPSFARLVRENCLVREAGRPD